MASDEQQYKTAMKKWEYLRDHEVYSRAPELGLTAVIYSHHLPVASEDDYSVELVDNVEFAEEARAIADNVNAQNGDAFIIEGISHETFEEGIMANRDVANVVVIGHGTFSTVFSDDGDSIDWHDISQMSTHLKTGYFEQRFCGNYRFSLSVPFGLFAVQSARNVLAAKGVRFSPETNKRDESLIKQITSSDKLSYRQVKQYFPSHPLFKNS
jgi:hypothetical protein